MESEGHIRVSLTKREKQIVDKLKSGWVFVTTATTASLCHTNGESEGVQLALFWRMENKGLISQQSNSPFDFVLTENLHKSKGQI